MSSLIYFFYLYMNIRPKLGVTLIFEFIIFLIEPIFSLQYCLYVSSATIIPLYFIYYIHRSAALIFRTLYPWVYEVLANFRRFNEYFALGNKSPVQRGLFRNSAGDLLPTLDFLGGLYNFCNLVIKFSLM